MQNQSTWERTCCLSSVIDCLSNRKAEQGCLSGRNAYLNIPWAQDALTPDRDCYRCDWLSESKTKLSVPPVLCTLASPWARLIVWCSLNKSHHKTCTFSKNVLSVKFGQVFGEPMRTCLQDSSSDFTDFKSSLVDCSAQWLLWNFCACVVLKLGHLSVLSRWEASWQLEHHWYALCSQLTTKAMCHLPWRFVERVTLCSPSSSATWSYNVRKVIRVVPNKSSWWLYIIYTYWSNNSTPVTHSSATSVKCTVTKECSQSLSINGVMVGCLSHMIAAMWC